MDVNHTFKFRKYPKFISISTAKPLKGKSLKRQIKKQSRNY